MGPEQPSLLLPTTFLKSSQSHQAALAGQGDYNGDGINDIAIAVTRSDDPPQANESLYIVFGKKRGESWPAELDVAKSYDAIITNLPKNSVVSGLGDVNSDGVDDFGITDPANRTVGLILGRKNWTPQLVFGADFTDPNG